MIDKKLPKVLISIPNTGLIRIETMVSIVEMLGNSQVECKFSTPDSCYVAMNRCQSANEAVMDDYDFMLCIDTDMIFPADALNTLLGRDKDIIGVTYNFRTGPPGSVIAIDPNNADGVPMARSSIDDYEGARYIATLPDEPFICAALGTGFLLIKVDVFRKLPQPWFHVTPYINGAEDMMGEDYWFCKIAKEHGYDIWCDPSIAMGHIGIHTY
jgi:hypothetical protein